MVIRFDKQQLLENQNKTIGVEGDAPTTAGKLTETEKIVNATKQKIAEGAAQAVGVSASNSGLGHDPVIVAEGNKESNSISSFAPTTIDGPVVEEEPSSVEESPEITLHLPDSAANKMDIDAKK